MNISINNIKRLLLLLAIITVLFVSSKSTQAISPMDDLKINMMTGKDLLEFVYIDEAFIARDVDSISEIMVDKWWTIIGYIHAVIDVLNKKSFCIPHNTKFEDIIFSVKITFLKENRFINLPASVGVENALSLRFPCT
jgi:hypothetical protein